MDVVVPPDRYRHDCLITNNRIRQDRLMKYRTDGALGRVMTPAS